MATNEQIARDVVEAAVGEVTVSTIKEQFDGDVRFETLVFPGSSAREYEGERYTTREDAIDGHARFVSRWSSDITTGTCLECLRRVPVTADGRAFCHDDDCYEQRGCAECQAEDPCETHRNTEL